jgi:hypothetical protein
MKKFAQARYMRGAPLDVPEKDGAKGKEPNQG